MTDTEREALRRVGDRPWLWIADGLIPEDLRLALAALELRAYGGTDQGEAGFSAEITAQDHRAVEELLGRLSELLGVSEEGAQVRLRRYGPGQAHPLHLDDYQIGGLRLVATVLLCLGAEGEGGETFFARAFPEPVRVGMRPGRLVVWLNVDPDGTPDPCSLHAGLAVSGHKHTATWFVYADPQDVEGIRSRLGTEVRPEAPPAIQVGGPVMHLIPASDAPEITSWLQHASAERGIGVRVLDPRRAAWGRLGPLAPGHLLYRADSSILAQRLEAMLIGPGVGHTYRRPDGAVRTVWHDVALLRAGLPMPRRLPAVSSEPGWLSEHVAELGGFPVVLRFAGGSGGERTVRCDSLASLSSVLDFAQSIGRHPELMAYIDEGEVWRAVVVGERCVSCYPNPIREGDFRSYAPEDPKAYRRDPPRGLRALAVAAAQTVDARIAGVDIVAHPTGRLYVLEANAPCYWGHPQEAGIDVAGAIVDHLIEVAASTPG